MRIMFGRCHSLLSLDLSNFNTAKVIDMGWMLFEMLEIKSLSLSSFN